jgi:hypothetical protein
MLRSRVEPCVAHFLSAGCRNRAATCVPLVFDLDRSGLLPQRVHDRGLGPTSLVCYRATRTRPYTQATARPS